MQIIERSAKAGSWVLVSTIRFPQFARRVCDRLRQLQDENKVDFRFRLIFDLQSFSHGDIPASFIFDSALAFHQTEQNTEDFEGFDDIWSAALDECVLIKLSEKVDIIKDRIIAEKQPKQESKSDLMSSKSSTVKKAYRAGDSPTNFQLIQSTVKSDAQKQLYRSLMQ